MIVYTLGRTSSYDKCLAEEEKPTKLGAYGPTKDEPDGYAGGAVWKTPEEVRTYIDTLNDSETWSIYSIEIDGDWEKCVNLKVDQEGFNRLLKDSPIIAKISSRSHDEF